LIKNLNILFKNIARRKSCWLSLLLFTFILNLDYSAFSAPAKLFRLSEGSRISLLTCSTGPDLYSIFGHTAIRVEDTLKGKIIDWVFNYGTFQFSDDFYYKFAKGQLDYCLSKEPFANFQEEYILCGRGIWQQDLKLTLEEKNRLLDALENNYLPENREYRYDFFYDNCSTRVRDIIRRSCGGSVQFTYAYPQKYTFRDAIQNYLDFMPWSDFGIDVALGMPCDKEMGAEECMFLPDSLMHEIHYATKGEGVLAERENDILPQEYFPKADQFFTPMVVFVLFLILHIIIGIIFLKRGRSFQVMDRLILFVTGLLGLLVVFLWFFTDHKATMYNLNILWANPMNLIIAFHGKSALSGWKLKYFKFYGLLLILLLCAWVFLPQRLHLAVIPVAVALLFTILKIVKPDILGKQRSNPIIAA
jgi:hypothetical protein